MALECKRTYLSFSCTTCTYVGSFHIYRYRPFPHGKAMIYHASVLYTVPFFQNTDILKL